MTAPPSVFGGGEGKSSVLKDFLHVKCCEPRGRKGMKRETFQRASHKRLSPITLKREKKDRG